jgi:hypothetical protein
MCLQSWYQLLTSHQLTGGVQAAAPEMAWQQVFILVHHQFLEVFIMLRDPWPLTCSAVPLLPR